MNITLRQMRILVTVADSGSFRVAAEHVHLSPGAVSLAVSEAEAQIGLKLFERTTRSVRVTPLGAAVLPRMQRILADCDLLFSDMQSTVTRRSGRVTVACLASIASRIMPTVISACRMRYRDVRIELVDDKAAGVYALVRDGQADFGLSGEWRGDPDLAFEPVMRDPIRFVCTRGHRFSRRRQIAWLDLENEPFVALSTATGIRFTIETALAGSGVALSIAYEVSQLASALGLLEAGLGVSALPDLALPKQHATVLVARPLIKPDLHRTVGLLRRFDRPLTPAAEIVRETVQRVCAGLHAGGG